MFKRAAEDEMIGRYHWCNGHEFEQTPGDSEGQGSLACCSLWRAWLSDWTITVFSRFIYTVACYQYFIPCNCWIILHFADLLRFVYPFLCWWAFQLVPSFGFLWIGARSRHIAYWVQHFPQHHLSGSGIAQLEFYHCREPAWGTQPMAKVMRKEAPHTQRQDTQRRDRASGVPLEILEHLPPKSESAYFLLCALTYTPDFTGGCPRLPLSEKRVNLQLQLTIPGCDSVSTYKLLWKSSSLPE